MSFKTIEQAPARLNRSELAVPGSQPKPFEKAAATPDFKSHPGECYIPRMTWFEAW